MIGNMASSSGDDLPVARLRQIGEEERGQHPWYRSEQVAQVAVCGASDGCEGWLAAVQHDSGGIPRMLLLPGTHRKTRMGWWWAKREPRRDRDNVLFYWAVKMAQVPLSGRPGRVKIQCPQCWHFSRMVVRQPRRARRIAAETETQGYNRHNVWHLGEGTTEWAGIAS